jgi:hypothetical protein
VTLFVAAAIGALGWSQAPVASDVYAALLTERYHGVPASQMVVKDTAVAMPTLRGSSSEWLKEFDYVASDLRRAASQPSPTKRRPLTRRSFHSAPRWCRPKPSTQSLRLPAWRRTGPHSGVSSRLEAGWRSPMFFSRTISCMRWSITRAGAVVCAARAATSGFTAIRPVRRGESRRRSSAGCPDTGRRWQQSSVATESEAWTWSD